MSRSKKVFIIFAVLFLLLLAYIAYDFARKTRFPGSSKEVPVETVGRDSVGVKVE